MARKDLLPSYLSEPAWIDLCNAIDFVFKDRIDKPTNNLGKLRRAWNLSADAQEKINNAQLLTESDMDTFERTILIRQLNMLGFTLRYPDGLTDAQLSRFVRHMAHYWYSKGKFDLGNFLGYVLNTTVEMKNMWTNDYKTFYPEGDGTIGLPIYKGGTWYPTTHTTVEVNLLALPPDLTLDTFGYVFTDLANYPLVLSYIIATSKIEVESSLGKFVPVALVNYQNDNDVIGNFVITAADETAAKGGGGFTPIVGTPIAGPGGVGYVAPDPVLANFTADVRKGNAPFTVNFRDKSFGPRSVWRWYFGDAAAGDNQPQATVQNPQWVYTQPGRYNVTLGVGGIEGVDTSYQEDFIQVLPEGNIGEPYAMFTAVPRVNNDAPTLVKFRDRSINDPTSWLWEFGDGTTSTQQNPQHAYSEGSFSVRLTAINALGSSTTTKFDYVQIGDPQLPVTDFTWTPQTGEIPLTVYFQDASYDSSESFTPVTDFTWTPESGPVPLTVSFQDASYDSAPQVPNTNFTQDVTSGEVPLTVHFQDTSTG